MIKVLLLILMYSHSTGEIVSVYTQNGQLPGFPTMEACETVVAKDLSQLKVPEGFSVYAKCIEPTTVDT